jgi:hypothetical protein
MDISNAFQFDPNVLEIMIASSQSYPLASWNDTVIWNRAINNKKRNLKSSTSQDVLNTANEQELSHLVFSKCFFLLNTLQI